MAATLLASAHQHAIPDMRRAAVLFGLQDIRLAVAGRSCGHWPGGCRRHSQAWLPSQSRWVASRRPMPKPLPPRPRENPHGTEMEWVAGRSQERSTADGAPTTCGQTQEVAGER
jgi:hypothetical protein